MSSSNTAHPTWRKSSRSVPRGGDCVEVANLGGRIGLRDSKAGSRSPVLAFPAAAFTVAMTAIKGGQFG